MAKQLKVNGAAISNSAKQARAAAESNMQDARKQDKKPKKSNSDYMRLDLIPTDEKHPYYGINFKEYVEKRASETSVYPEKVSATRYIQNLIYDDMQNRPKPKSKRQVIADKLAKVTDRDLETIESVIDAFIKAK